MTQKKLRRGVKAVLSQFKLKPKKDSFRSSMFAVVCVFEDKSIGFANFWGLPAAAGRYLTAVKMKNDILKKMHRLGYDKVWRDDNFFIVKITL